VPSAPSTAWRLLLDALADRFFPSGVIARFASLFSLCFFRYLLNALPVSIKALEQSLISYADGDTAAVFSMKDVALHVATKPKVDAEMEEVLGVAEEVEEVVSADEYREQLAVRQLRHHFSPPFYTRFHNRRPHRAGDCCLHHTATHMRDTSLFTKRSALL